MTNQEIQIMWNAIREVSSGKALPSSWDLALIAFKLRERGYANINQHHVSAFYRAQTMFSW